MTTDHQIDPRFRNEPYGYHLDINPLYSYREQLRTILATLQPHQDLLNRIDALLASLDEPMRVVVAGGFNAGKSTFLNALVNQRIMPVRAIRSTCTVNLLQGGTRRELVIHRCNGQREQRSYQNDADAQQQIDALMKTGHQSIARIAVCCPNQSFLERFTLIDTPGLDINAQDSAASVAEVKNADALIWVLHNKGAEKLDYEQIVQFCTANPDSPVIVILNQVDALEDDELRDALAATQDKFNAHVAAVLPLSAKLASEGQTEKNQTKLDASYFYELRSYLQHNLFDQYRTLQEKIRFQRRSQPLITDLQRFLNDVAAQQQPAAPPLINSRYADLGDGTVFDVKNNLQWMRCALGQTWDDKTCTGEAKKFTWEGAKGAANSTHHAGHDDWRLPTQNELNGLVVHGQIPTIDQQAFPNTPNSWFWSSSQRDEGVFTTKNKPYYVEFNDGGINTTKTDDTNYARLVREITAPIKGHYRDLGDGRVLDTMTNLQWMRCALGQTWDGKTCVGEAAKFNWNDLNKVASKKRYAGHNDWRLPTIDELKTLVVVGQKPTIDQQAFSNTPSSWFWSGSPGASNSCSAWYVSFFNGDAYYGYRNSGSHVRLVRGGQ
jgi:GTPase Era involved in 16S rRNA processing